MTLRKHRRRTFVPRGFNYDWTLLDGRAVRLEDILGRRADKLDADFRAMRRLGANTVRVFLPTGTFLKSPTRANGAALRRLAVLFRAAEQHRLRLILTGLSLIRTADTPLWVKRASDETIERAEITFWGAVARRCRPERSVFAYDLQNEPAIHWKDNQSLVDGPVSAATGEIFHYVHRHYRRIGRAWTRYIHLRFRRPKALAAHWPDYPRRRETWSAIGRPKETLRDPRYRDYVWFHRELLSAWALRLATAIRKADPNHLITVGAFDPEVMASAVDFYSVHLYPKRSPRTRFLAANRDTWRKQVEVLPADKPVLVEEFFPLHTPRGMPTRSVLNALFAATRARAGGWLTSYLGPPEFLRNVRPSDGRHQAAVDVYEQTLARWCKMR